MTARGAGRAGIPAAGIALAALLLIGGASRPTPGDEEKKRETPRRDDEAKSLPPLPEGARLRIATGGFHHDESVRCLAWSPDGTRIASGGEDGRLRLWHAATGTGMAVFPYAARNCSRR